MSYSKVNHDYIITHGFVHLAGLGHHGWTWGSMHTAIKSGCNADQSELRAEDIDDINDHYT